MPFVKARRDQAYLRQLLWGESGGGKSYTALLTVSYLVAEHLGRPEWVDLSGATPKINPLIEEYIAVIDGEARLREYSGGQPFWFNVEEPLLFTEEVILPILEEVRRKGFIGVLFDPFSHVWQGPGGTLARHGELGGAFKDWGPAKKEYRNILNTLLSLDAHVVATARAKVEKTIEGRQVINHGIQPVGEEGVEYEFSLVGKMTQGGSMMIVKSVLPQVAAGEHYERPGVDYLKRLRDWLKPQGTTEEEVSTFVVLRNLCLKAATPEAAQEVKARYLDAHKRGLLTIREKGLIGNLLGDVGQRLGLSKKGGA